MKSPDDFWMQLDWEGRSRLKSLFDGDEKLSDTFDVEFEKFLKSTNNSWSENFDSNEKIAMFWRRYPKTKYLKVLRRQLSGLCFFHACVVLQHYLVSINESDDSKNVGMLNIANIKDLY